MKKLTLLIILLCGCSILVSGCASQPTPAQEASSGQTGEPDQAAADTAVASQTAKGKREYVCSKESVVGSHMRKTVCRTRQQIEDEREGVAGAMQDIRDYEAASP
jgi:hypothetical protein|tara:strand:- start:4304 stop:4618 length:315 start_codon:yes stop_codon:yes gene_type:complete